MQQEAEPIKAERQQEEAAAKPGITPPRQFGNASMKQTYVPKWIDVRAGAFDHLQIASRGF